jgi:hypothetical protein
MIRAEKSVVGREETMKRQKLGKKGSEGCVSERNYEKRKLRIKMLRTLQIVKEKKKRKRRKHR